MEILEKDKKYVWHPFTQQLSSPANINIVQGDNIYLIDEKGDRYIDAISSWWVNLHGHCNPYISKKVSEQLFKLEHSIFSGFTHENAANLAERLLSHLPKSQSKIFYSDDGSTAVEVAIKMCLQYWHNLGIERTKLIAFENAYHGDTFGGMSVGARNVFSNAFLNLLFEVEFIPTPNENNLKEVETKFLEIISKNNVAGFIFEPLVQGAGGMLMYKAEHLDILMKIARDHQIITIADEVMTGFGRTGKFFAAEYCSESPDIFCLSKGLTGGYMPLGVTSCAQFIYDAYLSKDKTKTFFHGHSYTANPTACAAALASLDLLENKRCLENISMISEEHLSFKKKLSGNAKLKEIRCLGTIIAFELNSEEETNYLHEMSLRITEFFINKKIILRPLGNIFYILPPYSISKKELHVIYDAIEEFL